MIKYKLHKNQTTVHFNLLGFESASIPKGLLVFDSSNNIQIVLGHYPYECKMTANLISLKGKWADKTGMVLDGKLSFRFPTEQIADLYLIEYEKAIEELNQELIKMRNKTGLRVV